MQQEEPSGTRAKTGTRAFMAVGALLDDKQRKFMRDLESFSWVLFWIYIYNHKSVLCGSRSAARVFRGFLNYSGCEKDVFGVIS